MIQKILAIVGLSALILFPAISLAQDAYEATPKEDIQTGQSIAVNLPSVYVLDFKTDRSNYAVGDTVTGVFTLHNASDFDVSELKYTLSTKGEYVNSLPTASYHTSDLSDPLYIKANEKKTVSFSYTLPKIASGDLGIQLKLHIPSGQSLGWGDAFIQVTGETIQKLTITSAYLSINDEVFPIGSGPSIHKKDNEVVVLNLKYYNKGEDPLTFNPDFIVTKRIKDGEILLENSLDSVTLSPGETKEIEYALPTMDYEAGVYNVTFFFTNESGESVAQSMDTRYIISGQDAVIQNVVSNRSAVSKNESLTITVDYFGITPDLLRREAVIDSNDDTQADLIVKVTDVDSGETIAEGFQSIDLAGNGSIPVIMNTISKSDNLALDVQIMSKSGDVLASYNTQVPDSVTGDIQNNNIIFILLSILLILIMTYLISLKRKNINTTPVVAIVILVAASAFSANIIYAGYTANSGYIESQWAATGDYNSDVPSIFINSPLPPSVRTYEPGEVFPLQTEIRMPYCSNSKSFAFQHVINDVYNFNDSNPRTWNGPSSTTDDWSHLSNWKELSLNYREGESGLLFDSYPHDWNYSDYNATSEMFTAPQEEGIYRIYLYAGQSNQWSIGAWQSGWTAGYVEFEVKKIPEFGPLNVTCSFSPNPMIVNEPMTVTADITGGDGTYESIQWTGDIEGGERSITKTFSSVGAYNAYVTVSDGENQAEAQCPFNIEPEKFAASCRTLPSSPRVNETVTWESSVRFGKFPYTYVWSGAVSGTGVRITSVHDVVGSYRSDLTVTDSEGKVATTQCFANVRNFREGEPEGDFGPGSDPEGENGPGGEPDPGPGGNGPGGENGSVEFDNVPDGDNAPQHDSVGDNSSIDNDGNINIQDLDFRED